MTEGTVIENVFADKPFILPADCNGDVSIVAYISDLKKSTMNSQSEMQTALGAYVVYNNIPFTSSETRDIIIDPYNKKCNQDWMTDESLWTLEKIPAFYDNCLVELKYTVAESDDIDGYFNFKFGLKMEFATALPTWFTSGNPTSYNYDSKVMADMIKSSNNEMKFPSAEVYTTMTCNFVINTWNGLPPFKLGRYADKDTNGNWGTEVLRGLFTTPRFKLSITNDSGANVFMNNLGISFTWNYRTDNTLMDVRNNKRSSEYAKLYTLPKGSELNLPDNATFPLFAIVDGYNKLEDIIKVYGVYDNYQPSMKRYFASYIPMTGIPETTNSSMKVPTVWKSNWGINKDAFARMAYRAVNPQYETVKIITPKLAASDDYYRSIDVKIKDSNYDSAKDCVFIITTKATNSVQGGITQQELNNNIEKIHYFNVEKPFAETVEVARTEIDKIFYERLYQTYKNSVILQSIQDEPLYSIKFTVNDYATFIPIYHNGEVQFADDLSHCSDGNRSSTLFYFDNNTPNRINIQNTTADVYQIKFKVKYNVLKDVYVVPASDFGL